MDTIVADSHHLRDGEHEEVNTDLRVIKSVTIENHREAKSIAFIVWQQLVRI